ncbi:hypothetical protein ECP02994832_3289 [Escherichia coli P0299483.2]|nr:hypothetical protein ECP02994832_3289 [Escherichia coli P0299483.2]
MDQGITLDGGGLSPLARGTRCGSINWSANPRFIPAGAGNTRQGTITEVRTTVYPRWRGEHTKHT